MAALGVGAWRLERLMAEAADLTTIQTTGEREGEQALADRIALLRRALVDEAYAALMIDDWHSGFRALLAMNTALTLP